MAKYPEITYSLKALYNQYRDTSLLSRIEDYAFWTIPSVFPKGDQDFRQQQNRAIEYDYQAVGAMLVNRLATKLARTLFPANQSFFRIDVSDDLKQLFEQTKLDSVIEYENQACEQLYMNASYAQLVQAMRLLVITGECLLYRYNNALRVFSLKDYVLKRNNVGEVMDIVICEHKYREELTPDQRVKLQITESQTRVKLYTRVKRKEVYGIVSWHVTQEINGIDIGTNTVYRDKLCPFIPVAWNLVNGDSYGRGYVEDYAADFAKLSDMSRELMSYEMESLRLLHMVSPQGAVDIESAANAPNGEFIQGDPSMIKPYEAGSYQKIAEIRNDLEAIEQRLNIAFMYTGNMREGERVTAYEIRQNAEEAEQVLGGVYSQLSQSMHLPLAYLLLYEVKPNIMEAIDSQEIKLNILTGIQALSRSSENQGLVIACSELNAIIPTIAQLGKRFNIDAIADKVFASNNVNIKDITYTEEQLQANARAEQEAMAQQQAQMTQGMPQQLAGQESAIQAVQQAQQF